MINTILLMLTSSAQLSSSQPYTAIQSWMPIMVALLVGAIIGLVAYHRNNKQAAPPPDQD